MIDFALKSTLYTCLHSKHDGKALFNPITELANLLCSTISSLHCLD
jgi:hypothetical protein